MRYERILAAVAATPWAIDPPKGHVIADILSRRESGFTATPAEIEAAVAAEKQKPRGRSSVALIPVYGVMTQRADAFDETSGMVSTDAVGRMIDEAAADPAVEAIVLSIDSPGGSVFGVEGLGQKIAAAAKSKKVVAVADSMAASAAYWIAAQASELVVAPGGMVGSVGVYMMHVDRSEEMRAAGRSVTFVSAGERKTAGNQYAPLDATGRDEMTKQVNAYYDLFVKAVAAGRGVSQTRVREGFGKGGMEVAGDAVKEGMADRVATLDSVLARYGSSAADHQAAQPDRRELEIMELRHRMG